MKNLFSSICVFLLVCVSVVQADDKKIKDLPVRYKSYTVSYELDENASAIITYSWVMEVLKEDVLKYAKSTQISHSTSVERAEVLYAYTLKPDGKKVEVPESNFQLEVNSGIEDNTPPAFSDETTLTLVFPELEVGDAVAISYRITQKEQFFPGHFSEFGTFQRSVAYDDVQVKLSYPESLKLDHKTFFLENVQNTTKEGRRILEWKYVNKEPEENPYDGYSVYKFGIEPTYAFSTFESYAQIASAYGERATEKAAVTTRIMELADEIVGKEENEKKVAGLLYDWVAKNISYAGNCIGVGAVVPRDLDFVLNTKMGDCKDHATLYEALLNAKKIPSTQALIGINSMYELPEIPLVEMVNHVMNYLPSLDMYADSTSPTIPFGMLPYQSQGKPTLHVVNFDPNSKTPVRDSSAKMQSVHTTVNIEKDGSASGEVEIQLDGYNAIPVYHGFKEVPEDKMEKFLETLLQRSQYQGTLTLKSDFAENTPEHMKLVYNFKIENYLNANTVGGMELKPMFVTSMIEKMNSGGLEMKESKGDFTCSSGVSTETYAITFPETVEVLALPKDASFKNDYINHVAAYTRSGAKVTARREYIDSTNGPVCKPDAATAYHEIAKKIANDLRSQVVYRPL